MGRIWLLSSAETQPSGESQQTSSPTRGEAREGDSSLTGESGSDSNSGLSSGSDDESGSELESSAGPKVPSESPPDLPSQGDLSVVQRAQVNREQDSLRPGAILSSKGSQNINEPT